MEYTHNRVGLRSIFRINQWAPDLRGSTAFRRSNRNSDEKRKAFHGRFHNEMDYQVSVLNFGREEGYVGSERTPRNHE